MKILIEGFIYCFMFALICFVSLEFIVADKRIVNAKTYYNYVKDIVEINDFNPDTMSYLTAEAVEKGYELSFTDTSSSYSGEHCYWIELDYPVKVNILGVANSDTVSGYVKSYY